MIGIVATKNISVWQLSVFQTPKPPRQSTFQFAHTAGIFQEQKERLSSILKDSFLFAAMDSNEVAILIDAMQDWRVTG